MQQWLSNQPIDQSLLASPKGPKLDETQYCVPETQVVADRRTQSRKAGFKSLSLLAGIAFALAITVVISQRPAAAQVAPVDPVDPPAATTITPIQVPTAPTANGGASNTTTGSAASGGGITQPKGPTGPTGPAGPGGTAAAGTASLNLNLNQALAKPSQSIVIILLVTVLSIAPALLIMLTSFTRIIIVLGITRNALGVNGIPPNQVLVGLAMFLSVFIMAPTFTAMNKQGIQPYLSGQLNQTQAYNAGIAPLKTFMLKQTRQEELALFIQASGSSRPATPAKVSMNALAPAFILSELKTSMIIGFVIFIPFLVIDIIVSSSLMSMGMMMLPPQMISLPFKLLLFVLVDGWALVVRSLLTSFH